MTRFLRFTTSLLLLALQLMVPNLHASTLTVLNSADAGAFSLRQAIVAANSNPDADIIAFNLPGNGPFTINVLSPLPTLSTPLTIDGYTQPGAIANTLDEGDNAVIQVRIDGAGAGASTSGLSVCSGAVTIRGLSITGFAHRAIVLGSQTDGSLCAIQPSGAVVEGNFLGLAADGDTIVGNREGGMALNAAPNTRIGGSTPASRNLISGNTSAGGDIPGIFALNASAGSRIDGNYIGTDRSGRLDRGNRSAGISFRTSARQILVGADRPNRIAFNGVGISVTNGASGNSFAGNDIGPNDNLGIDLCALSTPCPDGVTVNDVNDSDSGGNNLQNFPDLNFANRTLDGVQLIGVLDRTNIAGTRSYSIAAYASASCDASGNGEGERYLGSFTFTSGAPSTEFFSDSFATSVSIPAGSFISATATDQATGDTSEFSRCVRLDNTAPIIVTNTNDSGAGSLRAAIVTANAQAGGNTIVFNIPGSGVKTITPVTSLPDITEAVLIDGYTQPGALANTAVTSSNAIILIEIEAGAFAGLTLTGSDITVRGLAVFGSDVGGVTVIGNRDAVEGCFVGFRADGTTASSNGVVDVDILNGNGHRVGGALPAQRNVVSARGNGFGQGIRVASLSALNIEIDGNLIGTDRSGTQAHGNGAGVRVANSASDVRIGTRAPNLIRFNNVGVLVASTSNGVVAYANDYADNLTLGIDLSTNPTSGNGITANDLNDVDSGGNTLQNFPVLSSAILAGGVLNFSGSLDVPLATPTAPVTLAFYASASCHASGNGEGAAYLGAVNRVISNTTESFSVSLPGGVPIGSKITATATRDGNTSEFSACVTLIDGDALFRGGFE